MKSTDVPATSLFAPPGDAVTVYPVMGLPFASAAPQDTRGMPLSCPSPPTFCTFGRGGASGRP